MNRKNIIKVRSYKRRKAGGIYRVVRLNSIYEKGKDGVIKKIR